MKKFAFFLIAMMFSVVASAQPLLYVEGKHYEVIDQPVSSTPNVTEYFSFYCPHCYRFEVVASTLSKSLPSGVDFKKSHVDFLRAAPKSVQHALSRAMVAADKMGAKDKVVAAIFDKIHQQRVQLKNEDDILKIFTELDLDAAKAKQLMADKTVVASAEEMKSMQDALGKSGALRGVPMLVVNGKYKILPKELRSLEDYQGLISYLLSLK